MSQIGFILHENFKKPEREGGFIFYATFRELPIRFIIFSSSPNRVNV